MKNVGVFLILVFVIAVLMYNGSAERPKRSTKVEPTLTPIVTPKPSLTPTPHSWAPPFKQLCERHKTLTDVQFVEYLESFRDKKIIDWTGWVYDVYDYSDGYTVLIAMKPPGGLLWARDIELLGLPKDQALDLQKEQKVVFSGTIRDVGAFLGQPCNPIKIEKATLEPVP